MTNLLELADRVEAAAGPDANLDKAIYRALPNRWSIGFQHYTASLDAAMWLVPEGFKLRGFAECDRSDGSGTYWYTALVAVPTPPLHPDPRKIGEAATGPLALTAACLRAIATQGEG